MAASDLSWSMWDLVLQPRIKPRPSVLGVWGLSHWTTREVCRDWFFGQIAGLEEWGKELLNPITERVSLIDLLCSLTLFHSRNWGSSVGKTRIPDTLQCSRTSHSSLEKWRCCARLKKQPIDSLDSFTLLFYGFKIVILVALSWNGTIDLGQASGYLVIDIYSVGNVFIPWTMNLMITITEPYH